MLLLQLLCTFQELLQLMLPQAGSIHFARQLLLLTSAAASKLWRHWQCGCSSRQAAKVLQDVL
jgi:hypothetical protein